MKFFLFMLRPIVPPVAELYRTVSRPPADDVIRFV